MGGYNVLMDLSKLDNLLEKEPGYRKKQVYKAVFVDLIADWKDATTLPAGLREELAEQYPLAIEAENTESGDSSKAVITLADGLKIETVVMCHEDGRNTVCVSSQVGCPLGCLFCATGKMGFSRNLNSFEIVEQVLFFARWLKNKGQKVTNVVFMGMGEPFLNYDNVIEAIRILNGKDGFNLGARRFSISTVGITEGIERLAKEGLQVNLAVSLHAADDKLRSKIIPINEKYPIAKVLRAVNNYIARTNRRVMLEYVMIKDLNDSDADARKLAAIVKRELVFVNLILYNQTGEYEPSYRNRAKKFRDILEKAGVAVTQRHRFGAEIDAACGQLATEHSTAKPQTNPNH